MVRKAFERGQTVKLVEELLGKNYKNSFKRDWKGVDLNLFVREN